MLIRRLHLENFKSYENATVAFKQGTNAIVGNNGAGKSSLVEAIGFALFDHTSAGRQSDLLRENSSSGRVVVHFVSTLDDREYEVERAFGKSGTTRHRIYDLENGRQILAESVTEVKEWLHEHLGIERDANLDDLFRNTIGVPQGSFTAPFLLAAGERKRIFDPLLQVDEYDRAFQNLRETTRYLGDQRNALDQEIARLEGQLEQLPTLHTDLEAVEQAIETSEQETASVEAKLRTARAELRTLDQAEQQLRQADQAHAEMRYQVDTARRDRETAATEVTEAQEAQYQVNIAEPGYQRYMATEAQLHKLETERTRRDQAQRERDRLRLEQAKLDARQNDVRQALAQIAEAAKRLAALQPQVEAQQALRQRLDEARVQSQMLSEAQRRASDLDRELERLLKRRDTIEAGMQQAETLETELAALKEGIADGEEQERQMRGERGTAHAEIERLQEQTAMLENGQGARCPTCEAELTPAHRQELLSRNQEQMRSLHSRLQALDHDLAATSRARAQAQQKHDAASRTLRGLPSESQHDEVQAELARRQKERDELGERIARLPQLEDEIRQITDELAALGDPLTTHGVLAARVAEGEARQQEMERLQKALADVGTKLALAESELEAYQGLDDRLEAVRSERESYRQDHTTYLTRIETARQLEGRKQRLADISQQLAGLSQHLEELAQAQRAAQEAYDAENHRRVRQQVEELSSEATRLRTHLSNQRERRKNLRREIARLEELQVQLTERQTAHEEIVGLEGLLSEMRVLLRAAGPFITQQLVAHISQQASSYYSDIMNDYTGRLNWSEDYELSLEVKGNMRGFQQLSGGEQMSAALALRLALLRQLSRIDVAFFDEPTAHLDPERREGLAEKIMDVKGFQQLFVISHDDTFERAAQSYLRVSKKNNISQVEVS